MQQHEESDDLGTNAGRLFASLVDKLSPEQRQSFLLDLYRTLTQESDDLYTFAPTRLFGPSISRHPIEGTYSIPIGHFGTSPSASETEARFHKISSELMQIRHQTEEQSFKLNSRIEELLEQTKYLADLVATSTTEQREWRLPSSLGINQNDYPMSQFVPVSIYLDTSEVAEVSEIIGHLGKFIESLGFQYSDEYEPKISSWLQRFLAKSRDILSSQEVQNELAKGRRALELAVIEKSQADVNKTNAEAASGLIKAIEGVDCAAIHLGSILLLKTTINGKSQLAVRDLSPQEIVALEENKGWLKEPEKIVDHLDQLAVTHEPIEI